MINNNQGARARLDRLANSYLDHIKIAIEAGDRGAPFRTFIDCWFAYVREEGHHRSSGDRQRWFNNPDVWARRAMLASLPFRSRAAVALMEYAAENVAEYRSRRKAKDNAVRVVVDHAVPVTHLATELFKQGADLSRDGISHLLMSQYRLGVITHDEDQQLRSAGLNERMPSNWDRYDVFARYRQVGIIQG